MKKTLLSFVIVSIIPVFFISCLTTIPALKSQHDALVVIIVEEDIDTSLLNMSIDSRLELAIKGIEKPLIVKRKKGLMISSDLSPGNYEITHWYVRNKASGSWVTDERKKYHPFKLSFNVKPGTINVFPVKFTYWARERGGGSVYQWKTYFIADDEKKATLDKLSKQKNFSQWKIDYSID